MKLLIYIPSYNRAESLRKQLGLLSLYSGDDELAVIVNDNCSTDDYSGIEKISSEYKFAYYRNVCNVGGNANILMGFMFCERADYIWILSDDDIIKPEAVEKIFRLTKKYDGCDLIYLTHNYSQEETFNPYNQQEMLSIINDGLGLISQVIYRSEYVKSSVRAGFDNIYSCFPHLAVLFEAVKKNKTIKICRDSKSGYFQVTPPELPAENGLGYKYSLFGFTLLANNLSNELRDKFLTDWWKRYRFKALSERNAVPMYSSLCFKMLNMYVRLFKFRLLICTLLLPVYLLRNKLFYMTSKITENGK